MTVLCGMCQVLEDPGFRLGIVVRLKCYEVMTPVGEHDLKAGTREEIFDHVNLRDQCADSFGPPEMVRCRAARTR